MATLPDFLGLDLGSKGFKLAQIKQVGRQFELKNFYFEKFSEDLLKNETEIGKKKLIDILKLAIKKSNISTKNCVIALPEEQVFARLLTLPKIKEEEATEAIPWALRSLIPVPLEDVSISFLLIEEYSKDDKKMQDWYTVAAPLVTIEKYKSIVESSGLKLLAVETEAVALSRLVMENISVSKDLLILDIGSENTNIILSRKSGPIFSQVTSTASASFTKAISTDYGISEEEAEKYKQSFGMDFEKGEGKIANTLKPVVDVLVEEVVRTIGFYKNKLNGTTIDKVIITGGGAKLPKLDAYFTSQVKIQTEVANIMEIFIMNKVRESLKQKINIESLSVSLGLAIKGYTKF